MGKNTSMKRIKFTLALVGFLFLGIASYAQTAEYPAYNSNDLKFENKIQIYPNPSVDFVKIFIEESNLVDPQIVVHSVIGNRLVLPTEKLSQDEFSVEVKNLPAGYYLLAVKDEATGFSKTYKFLKR